MKYSIYVKCYVGDRYQEIPIRDFMEIMAYQFGFDSYKELRKQGCRVELKRKDIIVKTDTEVV